MALPIVVVDKKLNGSVMVDLFPFFYQRLCHAKPTRTSPVCRPALCQTQRMHRAIRYHLLMNVEQSHTQCHRTRWWPKGHLRSKGQRLHRSLSCACFAVARACSQKEERACMPIQACRSWSQRTEISTGVFSWQKLIMHVPSLVFHISPIFVLSQSLNVSGPSISLNRL